MIDSFIIEITISIILLTIGYGWSKFKRKRQITDPVRKLWGIYDSDNIVIVVATSVSTDTGKYIRRSTGIGQVWALGASVESLSKVYDIKLDNILFSEDCLSNQIEKDHFKFNRFWRFWILLTLDVNWKHSTLVLFVYTSFSVKMSLKNGLHHPLHKNSALREKGVIFVQITIFPFKSRKQIFY